MMAKATVTVTINFDFGLIDGTIECCMEGVGRDAVVKAARRALTSTANTLGVDPDDLLRDVAGVPGADRRPERRKWKQDLRSLLDLDPDAPPAAIVDEVKALEARAEVAENEKARAWAWAKNSIAAPDLLEAVKRFTRWHEDERHDCELHTNPEKGACDYCTMLGDAHAAIAKATEGALNQKGGE